MQLGIISIFPEMFAALDCGITGKAIQKKILALTHWNPRDYVAPESPAYKHRAVDDRPYGGGPGMVMLIQPLRDAICDARKALGNVPVIHLSPQGKVLTQEIIGELAERPKMIMVASRYEGVDQRLVESEVDEEWSLGDYVLSGGELAAMVLIDAITRLLPGALGHKESAEQDSFMNGLLDCPHYTRPEEFEGQKVPRVLLEGNHQAIANWRLKQALGATWLKRPDLLQKKVLTPLEQQLLNDFIREYQESRGNDS